MHAPLLRNHLRDQTRPLHDQLDQLAASLRLETREDYRRFLIAHAQAVYPLEAALEDGGVARLRPDWADRRRSKALSADLEDLGTAVATHRQAPISDPDFATGCLYVLEGSRLGGRLLARQVATSGDPVVQGAVRYLTHGNGTDLWRSFVEQLNSNVHISTDRVVDGALHGFGTFIQAFSELEPAQ